MIESEPEYKSSPLISASIFSKATYRWLNPLLALGRKKQLQLPDLSSPVPDDEATNLTEQLEKEWNKELNTSKKPDLGWVLLRWYRKRLILTSLLIIIEETIKIIQPLLISQILNYFNGTMKLDTAILYGFLISLCAMAGGILHHPYYYNVCRYGMQLRVAVSGLIYKKMLKLSSKTLDEKSSGDIINLISNDGTRIEYGVYYIPFLITGPIQLIVVFFVIYFEIGLTFLTGVLLLAIVIPSKALIARTFNKFRAENCKNSDERVSLLTEIMNSIKIIKMYCWEIPFSNRVSDLRNIELKQITVLNLLQAGSATIDTIMATLMTFLNVISFVSLATLPLLPSYIVYSMGFYQRLCNSIGFNFTRAVTTLVNYKVSTERITEFLLVEEIDFDKIQKPADKTYAINIENLNFKWNELLSLIKKSDFSLKDVSLNVKKGEFAAIVGPVGSGKSTLLMSIIGEFKKYSGLISVDGKLFYIAQQPWVFTASLKQNIIFGSPFIQEKFDRIVDACSLRKDLELLAYGENTIVGEKGINLSGGQRARICMARALYSDADIYLFDDSLSAVDGTVAKNIIKNLMNDYLKSKTRILITHQVHHLETADKIFILNNGKIEKSGSFNELESDLASLSSMVNAEQNENEAKDHPEDVKDDDLAKEIKVMSDEIKQKEEIIRKDREEAQQKGAVSWASYIAYFTSGWGKLGLSIVMLFFVIAQGLMISADYWLSLWANNEESFKINQEKKLNCLANFTAECASSFGSLDILKNQTISLIYSDRDHSFTIYIILCCVSLLAVSLRSVLFYQLCVENSRRTYEKLFHSVRDTRIRFFELNPLGRILNRFSKDTNNMDEMLLVFLYEFLQISMVILGALVVPISINPWMLLPIIPLGVALYFIQQYFSCTGRELKRLDNIGRSPIFVHISTSIEGISTIRPAFKGQQLTKEFYIHNNYHTRAYFGFIAVNRWFGLRMDILCAIYTVLTLFGCIFLRDSLGLNSGQIGLLMVYLFQLFDMFQWGIVLLTYIENLMTSVERIVEYSNLPTEPLFTGKEVPPSDWPTRGEIEFNNVSLSYDKNLPDVLKGISLNIKPAEKIGIVGRTGAGKSSFFQTIFRMYEPTGEIKIDGINIQNISLNQLRSKLTIIPQEPILFSGSIRLNLDPFGIYKDSEIWDALDSVGLKELVQSTNGKLDSNVSSGGANLSVGQKQLICLARAVLKKTKILIIDEATANVDYKTDAFIQKTIREQFKSCTVLTIAHRLATVVDSDRILCLSEGMIKNFDSPSKLLADETSVLYDLTKKLSSTERNHIFEVANSRFNQVTKKNAKNTDLEKIVPQEGGQVNYAANLDD